MRFSTNDLANPALSGPAADPESDGLPNLAEYAHALEPTHADASPLQITPSLSGPNPTVSVAYEQLTELSDLQFAWESSANLLDWMPAHPTQEQIGVGRDPSMQRVTASFAVGDQMRFFRLRLTNVPPPP